MAKDFKKLSELYGLVLEQQQPSSTNIDLNAQQTQPQTNSTASGSLPEAVKALPKAQADTLLVSILGSIMAGDTTQLVKSVSDIAGMGNQLAMIPGFNRQNLQQTFNKLFSTRPNVSDIIEGGIKKAGQSTQQTSTFGQPQTTPQQNISNIVQGTLPKGAGSFFPTT
jgi:hypothetical protein